MLHVASEKGEGERELPAYKVSVIIRSIFKEKYVENENLQRIKLKLPALERKSTHLEEGEIVDTKPKVIKVAIDKLIPLKSEEVRKKF
jgi:hypothetical protein